MRTEGVTKQQASLLGALDTEGHHAIVIERTPSGSYALYDGPSQRIIEAGNRPAAIDAMLYSMNSSKAAGPVASCSIRHCFTSRRAASSASSAQSHLSGARQRSHSAGVRVQHALRAVRARHARPDRYSGKNHRGDREDAVPVGPRGRPARDARSSCLHRITIFGQALPGGFELLPPCRRDRSRL